MAWWQWVMVGWLALAVVVPLFLLTVAARDWLRAGRTREKRRGSRRLRRQA
ncbi:hypothetical protein SAMN06272739_2549 [Blastococcus haudaquaticus]|uniref:Uncharacterized protein n=1 Tax=Blastococcus haudaquaticus TaxID=1938745 RepID=A0A286GZ55_9ACTN|nr:hypothetical protein SAMN06272739_2549 [Blastococcus haudaquaticus]